jgi:hypothetical protein
MDCYDLADNIYDLTANINGLEARLIEAELKIDLLSQLLKISAVCVIVYVVCKEMIL